MFGCECRKLVSNRFLLGLFIILFILNAVLSYTEAKHDTTNNMTDNVLNALEAYNDDPVAWKNEYDRLATYYNDVFLLAKKAEMKEFFAKRLYKSKKYCNFATDSYAGGKYVLRKAFRKGSSLGRFLTY